MSEDLEARVRKADPERWLAARFVADPVRRAELIGLYALNDELAGVADQVSNPMIGDIRLAWWREGLEALDEGRVRAHPVLQALAPAVAAGRIQGARAAALADARAADLEPAPFADEAAVLAYIDGTAGALMGLAARLLAPEAPAPQLQAAGRAWGWLRLWRAGPALAQRNRRWTPLAWGEAEEGEIAAHVAHRATEALKGARAEIAALPVAAFPAVAYLALAGAWLRGREPGPLESRARLVVSTLTGRV